MYIYVDADACPVKEEIVRVARRYGIPVTMVMDTSHTYWDGYSSVITVDQEKDSVDMKLVNLLQVGDLVVTQDYGVATMALSKSAVALSQNGFEYTDSNLDQLLMERFLSQKARRAGKRAGKHKKRTNDDNKKFEQLLEQMIQKRIELVDR